MRKDNSIDVFFSLLRAGLWEEDVRLSSCGEIDFNQIIDLAQEQAVVGLVAAGLEHVTDVKLPMEVVLQIVGQALQLEKRNKDMNSFIGGLIKKMQEKGIHALLIKGQGIAQCYERPLWRASGDVDFLMDRDNYEKAKQFLLSLSSGNKPERVYSKEIGLNFDPWYVEVHGSLRTGLSARVDKVVDATQNEVFTCDKVRVWDNNGIQVPLPAPDNDVFFVFTHFIKHFYKEGMTLRQLCDWCRLLWTFKGKIDVGLLEERLNKAGLMGEWKAFAAIAVGRLGMPCDAMPLYDAGEAWARKGEWILCLILKGGEWRRLKDTTAVGRIFPLNTLRFLPGILFNVNWLKVKERLAFS